jgi:hypothetical protein
VPVRRTASFLAAAAVLLLAAAVCQASIDRGVIQGTVTDPQGALGAIDADTSVLRDIVDGLAVRTV